MTEAAYAVDKLNRNYSKYWVSKHVVRLKSFKFLKDMAILLLLLLQLLCGCLRFIYFSMSIALHRSLSLSLSLSQLYFIFTYCRHEMEFFTIFAWIATFDKL